jgi:hypothetical protein
MNRRASRVRTGDVREETSGLRQLLPYRPSVTRKYSWTSVVRVAKLDRADGDERLPTILFQNVGDFLTTALPLNPLLDQQE